MLQLKCDHSTEQLVSSLNISKTRANELLEFIDSIIESTEYNNKKSIVFENFSYFARNNEEYTYLVYMFGSVYGEEYMQVRSKELFTKSKTLQLINKAISDYISDVWGTVGADLKVNQKWIDKNLK